MQAFAAPSLEEVAPLDIKDIKATDAKLAVPITEYIDETKPTDRTFADIKLDEKLEDKPCDDEEGVVVVLDDDNEGLFSHIARIFSLLQAIHKIFDFPAFFSSNTNTTLTNTTTPVTTDTTPATDANDGIIASTYFSYKSIKYTFYPSVDTTEKKPIDLTDAKPILETSEKPAISNTAEATAQTIAPAVEVNQTEVPATQLEKPPTTLPTPPASNENITPPPPPTPTASTSLPSLPTVSLLPNLSSLPTLPSSTTGLLTPVAVGA